MKGGAREGVELGGRREEGWGRGRRGRGAEGVREGSNRGTEGMGVL